MMGSKWISIWLICTNTKCDIFFVHRMSLDPFWWDQLDQNSEGNKKLKFSNLGSVYRMILCGVQAKEKTPYSQMQLNNRNVLLFTIYQLTITPPKKNINYNFGFKLKLRLCRHNLTGKTVLRFLHQPFPSTWISSENTGTKSHQVHRAAAIPTFLDWGAACSEDCSAGRLW